MRYPIGLQSFEKIRKDGYVYVDKTDKVFKTAQKGGYYFLRRPRRFGKSLLVSTLEAYFSGKMSVFSGLNNLKDILMDARHADNRCIDSWKIA